MKRMFSACLLSAAASFFCPAARAVDTIGPSEVIASTFGAGDSYDGNQVYAIQHFPPFDGFPDGARYEVAARFGPTLDDYLLESTRLSIFRRFNGGPLPLVTIAKADGPSGAPGTVLAAKTITGFVPIDTPFQIETAPPVDVDWSAQNVHLPAGSQYWVYLSWPTSTGQEIYWSVNSIGATGNVAARGHGYGGDPNVWPPSTFFATTPAFSVVVSRVPEPASAAMALTAATLFRRRRQAVGGSP